MDAKRLYRSKTDRMIGGVCAGLGSYSNIDPLIVRIIFVGLALVNGIGIMGYLLLWVLVPEAEREYASQEEMIKQNVQDIGRRLQDLAQQLGRGISNGKAGSWQGRTQGQMVVIGLVILGLGVLILLSNSGLLHWLRFDILWPVVLIALGVALLAKTLGNSR